MKTLCFLFLLLGLIHPSFAEWSAGGENTEYYYNLRRYMAKLFGDPMVLKPVLPSVVGPMSYALVYTDFDRHTPGCESPFLMKSLKSIMDTRPAPRGEPQFRMISGCVEPTNRPPPYWPPPKSHSTNYTRNLGLPMDGLFGKPTPGWVPLDYHNIQCPDNEGLVDFRLETEWDTLKVPMERDQTRYIYNCRNVGFSSCTDHFSDASATFDPTKPHTFYPSLVRGSVQGIWCPDENALNGLQMKRNIDGVWGVQYRCCTG